MPASERPLPIGSDFLMAIQELDARYVRQGLCEPGEFYQHIRRVGKLLGQSDDLTTWPIAVVAVARVAKDEFLKKAQRRNSS